MAPCVARLFESINHSVRYGIRWYQSFAAALGIARPQLRGVDLAIDNDMNDMDPLRVKLAGQRLAKHAQSRFTDSQGSETGASPQCRGCAGKRDKAVSGLKHVR